MLLQEQSNLNPRVGFFPKPLVSHKLTILTAPFPTALYFKSSGEFSDHLSKKAREIKSTVNEIIGSLSPASNTAPSADLDGLRKSLTALLASQKEQMVKFDRLRAERDDISEQLGAATLRCIKAEKRLDRSRSAAVAKMEQQAISGAGNNAGSGIGAAENGFDTKGDPMNGIEESSASSEASQLALKEATAVAAKQKEQLDNLLLENKALMEQLTAANTRLSNLTDDDYAKTDLFKNFKSQHEEVIKRINHLEATNIQLREEAERLQAERTLFQTQLENETEVTTGDLESQLQRLESDLTRIRSARDELLADLSQRKASQEQERTAIDHMREFYDLRLRSNRPGTQHRDLMSRNWIFLISSENTSNWNRVLLQ
jgi:E3 ubiquitin-protein ligase BRE1